MASAINLRSSRCRAWVTIAAAIHIPTLGSRVSELLIFPLPPTSLPTRLAFHFTLWARPTKCSIPASQYSDMMCQGIVESYLQPKS